MRIKHIFDSPSQTIASILAMFCFGIAVGYVTPVSWSGLLLGLLGLSGFLAVFVSHREIRFGLLLVIVCLLALFRVAQTSIPTNIPSVSDVPSSAIRVSGTVRAEVERQMDGQRIVLDHVTYTDEPREGKLLMWAPLYPEIDYGEELVFNCRVQTPESFDGFAYDHYLASKGVYAVCYAPQYIDVHESTSWSMTGTILSVKSFMTHKLQQILPEPHSSFLTGLLFGGSSALSSDLKDGFRATGTSHILAASGFNISIFSLTFLSYILSTRIGRRRGLILTTILLAVYVVIAGASAAVVRAGIMGFLVVLEKWISRKASMVNALLLTAAIMLFFNPLLLFYDVGFQLSFVATIAVLTLTKPVSDRLDFIPDIFGLRQSCAGSLSAITLTLPIVLWHFGSVSLVAPFANLLVLPLVPYAMAATSIALLGSLIWIPLATILSLPAWSLSNVILRVIDGFASVPFALSNVLHARLLTLLIALIFFLVWFAHRYASSKT